MNENTSKEWNKDEAINPITLKVETMPKGSEIWVYDGKQLVQGESGQGLIEIAVILFIFGLLAFAVKYILSGNMALAELMFKMTGNG